MSLTYETDGAIARVTLNRPEHANAIDTTVVVQLHDACQALNDDPVVRAAVLTATGDIFSSGWDWGALAAHGDDVVSAARDAGMLSHPFATVAEMKKPMVCAINGPAIGGGLAMALACDVRVAADTATFSLPETGMGLVPMGGATQRLARLVGRGKALEMTISGESVSAEEALRIGLVSSVTDAGEVVAEAERIARRIAERGPLAIQYAKEAINRGIDMPLEQALRYETDLTIILQTTEDRAEGVRAFLEKREPKFKGS